jgi:mannose-6-phosphate isomerase-like protein (cupin superfamily)
LPIFFNAVSGSEEEMKTPMAMAIAVPAVLGVPMAFAQASVDHLTQGEMLQKAQQLEAKAAATGSASTKLAEYPNHYTMIAMREKDGGAEVHQNYADIFFVVKGKATLLTGGTVVDSRTTAPGETAGSAVKGGKETPLGEGDMVHIPAGTPHQLLVPEHGEFVYFVIKVKEQ